MTTDYKTLCPDPLESQTLKAKLPNTTLPRFFCGGMAATFTSHDGLLGLMIEISISLVCDIKSYFRLLSIIMSKLCHMTH